MHRVADDDIAAGVIPSLIGVVDGEPRRRLPPHNVGKHLAAAWCVAEKVEGHIGVVSRSNYALT